MAIFKKRICIFMTLVIIMILVLGYVLIATAHITHVNKAAIAMFMGAVGWVLYICYGADYVMSQHAQGYSDFLGGATASSEAVKYYICHNIFIKYVAKASGIVFFLLATMSIIEILNNNGCFDFICEWIRTRNSRRLLWTLTCAAFLISANLDNFTTTVMMLVIMRSIVQSRRQRMIVGSAIVLASNTGGCFTVIGDPAGVVLWGAGAVTASNFSAYLALPAIVAWMVPTWLLGRLLPDRLDVEWPATPYRGDDTNLNRWQRILMLLVGIGGLWFIPTFHNITKLSPFLGALCVLSILWVVNELFNRKLMNADQMIQRRIPRAIQYGTLQQVLFVMGIVLAMGVAQETGILGFLSRWIDTNIHNVWIVGLVSGLASGLIDSFTVAMTNISLYDVADATYSNTEYLSAFVQNGLFWKITAFSTGVGGSLLCFASTSGLALMKMERMRVGWYLKNCSLRVLTGWALGFIILALEMYIYG